jgi:O-succinylbenzoic acid--CoA ligase
MECNISIGDRLYSLTQFCELGLETDLHWLVSAQKFINFWLSGQEIFSITTSGSTGQPKKVEINRGQMIASAQATIKTLNLAEGTKALVCINTSFIGGQMMLVRAMVGNWQIDLVEPSIDLSESVNNNAYDFTALVPLQVNALLQSDRGKKLLNSVTKIIIGGAAVSKNLVEKLQPINAQCYHTYGMTETVSHIGLKPLNGPDKSEWFDVIGDNLVRLNQKNCLEIKGAVTNSEWIATNDIVEINGSKFKWLGRADLVVNSGGVKILIEAAEEKLNELLPDHLIGSITLWKRASEVFGEELIGISTSQKTIDFIRQNRNLLKEQLPKYYLAKTWCLTPAFVFTENGKVDRQATMNSSNEQETSSV